MPFNMNQPYNWDILAQAAPSIANDQIWQGLLNASGTVLPNRTMGQALNWAQSRIGPGGSIPELGINFTSPPPMATAQQPVANTQQQAMNWANQQQGAPDNSLQLIVQNPDFVPYTAPKVTDPTSYYDAINDANKTANARMTAMNNNLSRRAGGTAGTTSSRTMPTPSSRTASATRTPLDNSVAPPAVPNLTNDMVYPDFGSAYRSTDSAGTNPISSSFQPNVQGRYGGGFPAVNLPAGVGNPITPSAGGSNYQQGSLQNQWTGDQSLQNQFNTQLQNFTPQDPNPYQNEEGGLNYGAVTGMMNQLASLLYPQATNAAANANTFGNIMANEIFGNFPSNLTPEMLGNLSQQGLEGANLRTAGLSYLFPFLDQLGAVLPEQLAQGLNVSGQGGNILGANNNYGLSQLYQQIMQSGLPNQRGVESLFEPQSTLGQNQQAQGADILSQMAQGGNYGDALTQQIQQQISNTLGSNNYLTPEYVQAMRELVLDPQQEAMAGRINQLAGGSAALTSPAYQELMRRNEQDFQNQLIVNAFDNQGNLINQGLNAGQQGFGQGLNLASAQQYGGNQALQNAFQSFGIVPQSVSPFTGQAASLAPNLLYYGLSSTDLANSLAYQPYTTGLGASNSTLDRQMQLLSQYVGAGTGLTSAQQQYGLGTTSQLGAMNNDLLNAHMQNQSNQNLLNLQGAGSTGQALANLLNPQTIAAIAGLFGLDLGGTSDNNYGGTTGTPNWQDYIMYGLQNNPYGTAGLNPDIFGGLNPGYYPPGDVWGN